MEDALLMLSALEGKGRLAVLGNMEELGSQSEKFHYKIGKLCTRIKLDTLITYGPKARFIAKGTKDNSLNRIICCKTYKEVVKSLIGSLKPFSAVLVKGSRATQMENIVEELLCSLKR